MKARRGAIAKSRELLTWLNAQQTAALFVVGIVLLIGAPLPVVVLSLSLGTHPSYASPLSTGWGFVLAIATSIARVGIVAGLGLIGISSCKLIRSIISRCGRVNLSVGTPDATPESH